MMIQEMLQVENSFQLVVISEEDDTQISYCSVLVVVAYQLLG